MSSENPNELSTIDDKKNELPHSLPVMLNVDIVTNELDEIERKIKELLAGTIGNTYKGTIRYIANAETEIQKKDMNTWQRGVAVLKSNLLVWKEYVGSEASAILETKLLEDKKNLQERYPMNDDQTSIISDHIRTCTHERLSEIMDVKMVGKAKTHGNIIFDPQKRIDSTPDVLKTHWPENKGTIPELLVLIDLINLMIAKIELLSKKTVLSSLATFGMSIEDIVSL